MRGDTKGWTTWQWVEIPKGGPLDSERRYKRVDHLTVSRDTKGWTTWQWEEIPKGGPLDSELRYQTGGPLDNELRYQRVDYLTMRGDTKGWTTGQWGEIPKGGTLKGGPLDNEGRYQRVDIHLQFTLALTKSLCMGNLSLFFTSDLKSFHIAHGRPVLCTDGKLGNGRCFFLFHLFTGRHTRQCLPVDTLGSVYH